MYIFDKTSIILQYNLPDYVRCDKSKKRIDDVTDCSIIVNILSVKIYALIIYSQAYLYDFYMLGAAFLSYLK